MLGFDQLSRLNGRYTVPKETKTLRDEVFYENHHLYHCFLLSTAGTR